MAKPLRARNVRSQSVCVCLLVSGSAAEQVSLETRRKQLQRLKIPDLFWQPVPCQWCSHGERTFSEIWQRRGRRAWTIVVRFCQNDSWDRLTKVYKVLRCKTTLSLVDQETWVCSVTSVQQATNEADHTAHNWSNLFSSQMCPPALFIECRAINLSTDLKYFHSLKTLFRRSTQSLNE